MAAFDPCTSCHCHIKRTDPTCPFCGRDNAKHSVVPARGRPVRMSRRELVAIGSALALAACSSPAPVTTADASVKDAAGTGMDASDLDATGPTPDAAPDTGFESGGPDGSQHDAAGDGRSPLDGGSDAHSDALSPADAATDSRVEDAGADSAVHDAGPPDGQLWACASQTKFACGSGSDAAICSADTEACWWNILGTNAADVTCEPYGSARLGFPSACGPCPTCACLTDAGYRGPPNYSQSSWQCTLGDAGEVEIVNHYGCYGAPPARPERMAA